MARPLFLRISAIVTTVVIAANAAGSFQYVTLVGVCCESENILFYFEVY